MVFRMLVEGTDRIKAGQNHGMADHKRRGRMNLFFILLCPDLIAGCEDLTQRRRGSQRFAEGSSSLRFSALSLRLGVKNGAFGCGSAAL